MKSAAFCKGEKKGKMAELSQWSRGPSLRCAMRMERETALTSRSQR